MPLPMDNGCPAWSLSPSRRPAILYCITEEVAYVGKWQRYGVVVVCVNGVDAFWIRNVLPAPGGIVLGGSFLLGRRKTSSS